MTFGLPPLCAELADFTPCRVCYGAGFVGDENRSRTCGWCGGTGREEVGMIFTTYPKTAIYSVEIVMPICEDPACLYEVNSAKFFGSMDGSGTHCQSIEEVRAEISRVLQIFAAFDHNLQRMPNPMTMHNLHFSSCTQEIKKEELFVKTKTPGQQQLRDFAEEVAQ